MQSHGTRRATKATRKAIAPARGTSTSYQPLTPGDVVLADVPFEQCRGSKVRPAVVLHQSGRSVYLCPFYTKPRAGTTYVGATATNGLSHGSNLAYSHKTVGREAVLKRLGTINPSIAYWLLPGNWGDRKQPAPLSAVSRAVLSGPLRPPKQVAC